MEILSKISEIYSGALKNLNVLVCTHTTDATVIFLRTLSKLDASIVFFPIEYSKNRKILQIIKQIKNTHVLDLNSDIDKLFGDADIIIEDGFRLSKKIYECKLKTKKTLFVIEQTSSGLKSQRNFPNSLNFDLPIIDVAYNELKYNIENFLCTPEKIVSILVDKIGITMIQKNIMILGFGSIGNGIARICKNSGAHVFIVETNHTRREIARSFGYVALDNTQMIDYLKIQNIIISCTDNQDGSAIGVEEMMLLPDSSIMVNAGSMTGEFDHILTNINNFNVHRSNFSIYKSGNDLICKITKDGQIKSIRILSQGFPINLRKRGGTSSDALDYTFSIMIMAAIKCKNKSLERKIHDSNFLNDELLSLKYNDKRNNKNDERVIQSRNWGSLEKIITGNQSIKNFSMVRAVFEPNTNTWGHYHLSSEEAYYVLEGLAKITMWDVKNPSSKTSKIIKTGDVLQIPKGITHKVYAEKKFVALVIASPPFSIWDQFFPDSMNNDELMTKL